TNLPVILSTRNPAPPPATIDPMKPPTTVPTPGIIKEPTAEPPTHPAVPPATVDDVFTKFVAICLPEIRPLTISVTSKRVRTAVVTAADMALPFRSLAALFIAAAPETL